MREPRNTHLGVTSHYGQQVTMRITESMKAEPERARNSGKVLGRPDSFELWAPLLAGMQE